VKRSRNRPRSAGGKCSATRPTKPANPKNQIPAAVLTRVSDPFDAREALQNLDLAAVGRYFRDDVVSLLRLIADHRHLPQHNGTRPPGYDPDQEFEYETEDMRWAIENGHAGFVYGFLRQLAPVVAALGDMLDPDGRSELQLKPGHRGRGKPRKKEQKSFEETIHQELRFARVRAGGKLEAAVAEVSRKHRISRTTAFRIWNRFERTRRWGP
jgi:hypothetical protein